MMYQIEEKDVQAIFQMLGDIPLKFSGPVFGKLQESIKPQEEKQETPEE